MRTVTVKDGFNVTVTPDQSRQKRSSAIAAITWDQLSNQTSEIVTTIAEIDLILKFFLNDDMKFKSVFLWGDREQYQ